MESEGLSDRGELSIHKVGLRYRLLTGVNIASE